MTGQFGINTSHVRTEVFSKRPVTVFPQELEGRSLSQTVQFAQQIANLKSVQTYFDPFFVMDMGRVTELMNEWKTRLPRVVPFYSINCNDDMVLLKLLANYNEVGFNCQSRQNVDKALEFVNADRILYSNPLWTRSALSQAMEYNVNLLQFETARDLDRILMNHPNAELLLHICVNGNTDETNTMMGCDLENAPELLQLAASSGANCVGIAFTVGTGYDQPSVFESAIESAAQLFDFGRQLGFNMHTLNLGGGFSHTQCKFEQACEYINQSLDYFFPSDCYPHLRIIATPGRFFALSPFSLVTNIVGRKSVDLSNITNDDFDSGREAFIYQTNESYYGPFGCRLNAVVPECRPLFDHYLDEFQSEHVYGSVIGSALDEMDIVQQLCRFRPLDEGDWLIWQNMGAYTMNNKASLDDDQQMPVIFYFASQKAWNSIEFSSEKSCELSSDGSLPTSPLHSVCDDEMGSCSSSNNDYMADLDDQEDDFLTTFGWPFHE